MQKNTFTLHGIQNKKNKEKRENKKKALLKGEFEQGFNALDQDEKGRFLGFLRLLLCEETLENLGGD